MKRLPFPFVWFSLLIIFDALAMWGLIKWSPHGIAFITSGILGMVIGITNTVISWFIALKITR